MSSPGERRRLARIPLSCRVVVGERFSSWVTRTQDVGPRGCRLETTRPVRAGTLLQLRLELEGGQAPLEAVGQVVWTREAPVLEAGVAFTGNVRGGPAGGTAWLDGLLAAELRRAWREGRRLGPLGEVRLHLGSAPGVRLDDDALAVLRGVRGGEPISGLVRTGAALDAVLRLLATGTITAIRANIDPEGWRRAFAVFSDFAKESEEPRRDPAVIVLPPVPEADRPRVRAIEALVERYLREPR
jgi:PilZ domain-containing protein